MATDAPSSDSLVTTFSGALESNGARHAVRAMRASRFSLYVTFDGAQPPAEGTTFTGLTLHVESEQHRLGPCRFTCSGSVSGAAHSGNGDGNGARHATAASVAAPHGRLIFLDDVYDFDSIVNRNKFVNIEASFRNLPLVLQQKQSIRESFKRYTDDVTYDFGVYKRFFDAEDRKYVHEPEDVRAGAQAALVQSEGQKFLSYFQRSVDRLDQLVAGFTREEHQRHGFYFRNHAWQFILLSELMARTNLKPRGYIGDSDMLEMVYENGYRGNFVFPKLLHKYPVSTTSAQAVRNRRDIIPRELRRLLQQGSFAAGAPFRFLSVACGGAVEVSDMFSTVDDPVALQSVLLDQDQAALATSRAGLDVVQRERGIEIDVTYITESVRTMLRGGNLVQRWGSFDFVYSMGLFDYLTPPVARIVTRKLVSLLRPGGEVLIGNFHVGNPTRYFMEYWLDWVLYYRTEEEQLALADGIDDVDISVFRDDTGVQLFLRIRKR